MRRLCIFSLCLFLLIGIYGCGNTGDKEFEFIVEDVIVSSGKYELDDKLTIPKSKSAVPAVVLVHGSGQLDMDSTINSLSHLKTLLKSLRKKV